MLASLLLLAGLSTATPMLPVAHHEEESEVPPMTMKLSCHPREELIAQIKDHAGAVPMFVALGSEQGTAMEIWRDTIHPGNPWISLITRSDGISCIVMQGQTLGFADPDAKATPHTEAD